MSGRADLPLEGRLVVLGVTGSIAAYKSAELARALQVAGAEVQPVMTHSAARFIGPLTLETLTRRKVMLDPLELLPDGRIGHIVAADTADAIVVAPATARWISAMAAGMSDDEITAACLAAWGGAPVIVAPAMDGEMYSHPATRGNLDRLRSYGYSIVEPDEGPLASGQVGRGRLAEGVAIVAAVVDAVGGTPIRVADAALRPPLSRPRDLDGVRLLVTAGGTAEAIDPVRFIGNRSTGKMGVAIADAALARGATVTLIVGMTSVPLPPDAKIVRAESTEEMRTAVLEHLGASDALVMAAAVADFRPTRREGTKLARGGSLAIDLEATPDILAEVGRIVAESSGARPVLVGFAAETGSLDRVAEKAARKRVDLLVANDESEAGSGFGTDTNRVTLVTPGAPPDPWPMLSKRAVADGLLDRIAALLAERAGDGYSPQREQDGSPPRPVSEART